MVLSITIGKTTPFTKSVQHNHTIRLTNCIYSSFISKACSFKLQLRSRLNGQRNAFRYGKVLCHYVMHVRIKRHVFPYDAANLHTILHCESNVLSNFVLHTVARALDDKADMSVVCTVVINLYTQRFGALTLAVCTKLRTEVSLFLYKFHNLRILILAKLYRQLDVLSLAPGVTHDRIYVDHLASIRSAVAVTDIGAVVHLISYEREFRFAVLILYGESLIDVESTRCRTCIDKVAKEIFLVRIFF